MHGLGNGYDQWKTASPYDDDMQSQEIAEALLGCRVVKGHGRCGQGMNGKNADLDGGGQCVVRAITVEDPVGAVDMRVVADLHLYASVCEPFVEYNPEETEAQNEQRKAMVMDLATEVVCGELRYAGEWTGSDYWCFSLNTRVSVPLSLDEYEACAVGDTDSLSAVGMRLAAAITVGNEEKREFERAMVALRKGLHELVYHRQGGLKQP